MIGLKKLGVFVVLLVLLGGGAACFGKWVGSACPRSELGKPRWTI